MGRGGTASLCAQCENRRGPVFTGIRTQPWCAAQQGRNAVLLWHTSINEQHAIVWLLVGQLMHSFRSANAGSPATASALLQACHSVLRVVSRCVARITLLHCRPGAAVRYHHGAIFALTEAPTPRPRRRRDSNVTVATICVCRATYSCVRPPCPWSTRVRRRCRGKVLVVARQSTTLRRQRQCEHTERTVYTATCCALA